MARMFLFKGLLMSGFIALHLGAGYHAQSKRRVYKSLCDEVCKAAVESLKLKKSAVDVVSDAIAMLEDSPFTNAGVGSNLTLDGTVECDAAVMDGVTLNFGSVGSIYGIKNPIKVAQCILNEQSVGLLSLGRIPPCTLVGKGAVQWAQEHNFEVVDPAVLMTQTSKRSYVKYQSLLEQTANSTQENYVLVEQERLDTVGGLCIDMEGNVASAVSSGGLLLKHTGRVGQASVFGAGCWAQNGATPSDAAIAVSVSGVGEYVIKTLLAKECYEYLSCNSDSFTTLSDMFRLKFMESPHLRNISAKLAGVLSLTHNNQENVSELSWVHNTRTFLISYMSVNDRQPHCIVSEQTSDSISGDSIVACGKKITYCRRS